MTNLEPISKSEYLRDLIARSAAGRFPSGIMIKSTIGRADYPRCQYRGADGNACAFGILIPDDKHRPDMEGTAANEDFLTEWTGHYRPVEGFRTAGHTMENDYMAVQNLHDRMAFPILRGNAQWDHAEFVKGLRALPCFQGVEPAP